MPLTYKDSNNTTWSLRDDGEFRAIKNNYNTHDLGSESYFYDIESGSKVFTQAYYYSDQVTTTPSSLTTPLTSDGFTITRTLEILSDGAGRTFLRIVDTFTNTSTINRSLAMDTVDDLYADSNTILSATSSGDTIFANGDDWYVTSAAGASYPFIGHVVSGGSPDRPVTAAQSDADSFTSGYSFDLGAGQSTTLVQFYVVADTQADATALATDLATLPSYALTGLTELQIAAIANYVTDVTSAVDETLGSNQRNLTLTGTDDIDGTGNARDNIITGNAGANVLIGLNGNDTLDGGAGTDRLVGGRGNDLYIVDQAGDTVEEANNQGVDTISSSRSFSLDTSSLAYVENLTLRGVATAARGNAAANVLTGNDRNNTLSGYAGSDTLDGGVGADRMNGGTGNDTYVVDDTGDVVVEAAGEGTDTVRSSVSRTLEANVENLTLTGTAITGTGNALDNVLIGNGATNVLTGLAGNDTYHVDQSGDRVIEAANEGTDIVRSSAVTYTLSANVENLTLTEGSAAIRGVGNNGANILAGNSGNNTLDGRGGADVMRGGTGSDTYVVDNVADSVIEKANAGIDTVQTGLASYTLGVNVENGTLLGSATTLIGNALDNTLVGTGGANTLQGQDGDDTLRGGGGNDTLEGGNGDDYLVGDSGGPERAVASGTATVGGTELTLNLSAPETGTGSVVLSGSIGTIDFAAAPINIVYVLDQSGSTADPFLGSTNVGDRNGDGLANTILDAEIASFESLNASLTEAGLGGQARLALVAFSDYADATFTGNPDTDIDGDGIADVVEILRTAELGGGTNYTAALEQTLAYLENQGSGKNLVFFLSDGEPNDRDYETTILPAVRATGEGGTVIRAIGVGADAGEEVLDILDDGILNGSAEIVLNPEDLDAGLTGVLGDVADGAFVEIYRNDELVQVIGREEFTVSPLGIGFKTGALALSASGTDTFRAILVTADLDGTTVSTTLPVTIGAFASNDILNGGAGDDILDGGIGADRMAGGADDDTYVVDNAGDTVTEIAGEGFDSVLSRVASYTLTDQVESLSLGVGALNGTGNALDNFLGGNEANNRLVGGAGNDSLFGGDGNDTLDGGTGDDDMEGGDGDDRYVVDSVSDTVFEYEDSGIDTLTTVFSTSLGGFVSGYAPSSFASDVERLVLGGTVNLFGIGSAADNDLLGNSGGNALFGLEGDDLLDGGAGNDTLDGGAGNDTFIVTEAGDVVIDASGFDTVTSSLATYTLGSGIERLVLAVAANTATAIGNAAANTLEGNGFANVLDGGLGADIMSGGRGSDRYLVDDVRDVVIEAAGSGADTVEASTSFKISANVENLTLTGTGNFAAAGNDGSNVLIGNSGANRILGLAGNDTLDGGAGKDTLIGGLDNDTYLVDHAGDQVLETVDQGNDRVVASVSFTLAEGSSVETLTFAASVATANLNLTGNAFANTLIGNAGNNTLSGGAGIDILTGKSGSDIFVFSATLGSTNVDRITDFSVVDDTIRLSKSVFGDLALGQLAETAFKAIGTNPLDTDDRVLFNKATGEVSYDADGSGTGQAILFATLDKPGSLTFQDFLVA
ncbi:Bifunctional hemolysin/adenylate cyclase [Methylobacterium bullatum]|uniref:Bifunctional hemolysin/adenylate cyclase n=1 Tax=Methylobacterium bullatum TaxID=570505 RepID=A0A679IXT1_9HYPH|nr:Bifunctional hemolysin/adenylate cyclase [Methylobacterium bullatum]